MIRPALLLALAWGVCCAGAPDRARAAGPVGLTEYLQSIHQVRTTLDSLVAGGQAGAREMEPLRRQLESVGRVRLPAGRILTTDTPLLADKLVSADPASVRQAAQQLDALDDGLVGAPVRAADPKTLRKLDEILRDPRFHSRLIPIQPLLEWLGDLIRGLLRGILGGYGSGASVWSVLFLLLVAAVIFTIARGARGRIAIDAMPPGRRGLQPDPRRQAMQRASEQAAAGDYRMALRYLFLATMLELQDCGLLQLRPGLTNRDYLQLLSEAPLPGESRGRADRGAMQELIVSFDRAWYGHQAVDAEEYARCRQLSDQVLRAARGRAAA